MWDILNVVSSIKARDGTIGGFQASHGLNIKQLSRSLLIVAICIDQNSVRERNHQVGQIGRIYSSASKVISWMVDDHHVASLLRFARARASRKNRSDGQLPNDLLESLRNFRSSPYWTRALITQETSLARDLHFVARTASVSLADLWTVGASIERVHGHDMYRDLWRPIRDIQDRSSLVTLLRNVWRFRNNPCTNLRDLVYALKSVSTDGDELDVDYACSR
jgi:hypothetical protein